MRNKFIVIILSFILLGAPLYSSAQCPDFESFLKKINPARRTWNEFYELYIKCNMMDDGVYGEGFSDFVVQSLAKYWFRFDQIIYLNKKDPNFKKFILKHIDIVYIYCI